MRTIRTYLEFATQPNHVVELTDSAFQHLVKVLRLGNGAPLEVFNGHGNRYEAELVEVSKKRANVLIKAEITATPESPLHTHMGIVMSKGDRFDFAIQKATEMGVTSITPLTSERCDLKLNSERAEKKMTHWQGVIVAACEQSYRDTLPVLYPIKSLQHWVEMQDSDLQLVFHTAAIEPTWPEQQPQSVSFLVGPEGGLTDDEVHYGHKNDFISWQLGPRILRTETAPIAILSLLQMKWGDF